MAPAHRAHPNQSSDQDIPEDVKQRANDIQRLLLLQACGVTRVGDVLGRYLDRVIYDWVEFRGQRYHYQGLGVSQGQGHLVIDGLEYAPLRK